MRILFSFLAAAAAFILVFFAIFFTGLMVDIHYAPHDGQGGMGGFFLGIPVAFIAAIAAGIIFYTQSKRRGWL